eukprot:PhF_6_TR1430/c0_g1_i1/m.2524
MRPKELHGTLDGFLVKKKYPMTTISCVRAAQVGMCPQEVLTYHRNTTEALFSSSSEIPIHTDAPITDLRWDPDGRVVATLESNTFSLWIRGEEILSNHISTPGWTKTHARLRWCDREGSAWGVMALGCVSCILVYDVDSDNPEAPTNVYSIRNLEQGGGHVGLRCMEWLDRNTIVSALSDGRWVLWDIRTNNTRGTVNLQSHAATSSLQFGRRADAEKDAPIKEIIVENTLLHFPNSNGFIHTWDTRYVAHGPLSLMTLDVPIVDVCQHPCREESLCILTTHGNVWECDLGNRRVTSQWSHTFTDVVTTTYMQCVVGRGVVMYDRCEKSILFIRDSDGVVQERKLEDGCLDLTSLHVSRDSFPQVCYACNGGTMAMQTSLWKP